MLNGLKNNKKTYSKTKKMWAIVIILLILTIPTTFLWMKIDERKEYKNEALEFLRSNWGEEQIIKAPRILASDGHSLDLNDCDVKIELQNEYRKKGVFKIPVYIAEVNLKGNFKNKANKSVIIFPNIKNIKNLVEAPKIIIEKKDVSQLDNFEIQLKDENLIPFEISYKIKGSQKISVLLSAENNNINIFGNWKSLTFAGDYLPDKIDYSKKGFNANYSIVKLVGTNENSQIDVLLNVPFNYYKAMQRLVKYSFMFLCFIFTIYYLFEILSRRQIHPLQYLLLGIAVLSSYLFLTSLCEIFSFVISYIFSSILLLVLFYFYTYFVITKKDKKNSLGIILAIVFLQIFFLLLLVLKDYSFLIGSFGILIAIALIMFFVKDIDWYSENN